MLYFTFMYSSSDTLSFCRSKFLLPKELLTFAAGQVWWQCVVIHILSLPFSQTFRVVTAEIMENFYFLTFER